MRGLRRCRYKGNDEEEDKFGVLIVNKNNY